MQINESHIEKFVRFPESLTADELKAVQEYIANDKTAKELVEFYTNFYAELDQLNRPQTIALRYYKPKIGFNAPFVLAADSHHDNSNTIVTKATYSSEETGTLVRILENKRDQSFQLHVLSKLLDTEERVLVHFNQPPLDFVTEKGGVLKNIKIETLSAIDWASLTLVLSLPRSNCSYHPDKGIFTVCDECTLSVSDNNKFLFQTTETDIKKVLLEQDDRIELFSLEGSSLLFTAVVNKPFTIYLYS